MVRRPIFLATWMLLITGCGAEQPSATRPVSPATASPDCASPAASNASVPTAASATATAFTGAAPPVSAGLGVVCHEDAECMVSTFHVCCSCCDCQAPSAILRTQEDGMRKACALKDCPSCELVKVNCTACVDPEKEGLRARCVESKCALVSTPPTTVACKTVDDCWVGERHEPTARPPMLRGKVLRPCKDSEHAPACVAGACIVRHFKC